MGCAWRESVSGTAGWKALGSNSLHCFGKKSLEPPVYLVDRHSGYIFGRQRDGYKIY